VEVSALTQKSMPGLSGPSPLLRLQSDERLIALTRRGQHAAFEVLFSRYQSRLLAFCRHMLSSREDAEDVLQEVFTAAFNAILADDREINVRPWLYRIARNRSLNHLRRASAIGVDSMDVHFADNGLSTGERVMRRESFRQLLGDVNELPETQRSALLLREIDALSYEQIADAMETTVPSVKSLLVRARISLAEAAEARELSCEEVRLQLGETAEGLTKLGAPARRHVRGCERCRFFKKQLKTNNQALAAIFPVGALLVAKKMLLAKLGSTASAGGAHVGAGAGTAATATATASAAAGAGGTAGGILTAGAGAIATKAVAGLAAAAIVTAGAVEAQHASTPSHPHHAIVARTYTPASHAQGGEPVVVRRRFQPASAPAVGHTAVTAAARLRAAHARLLAKTGPAVTPSTTNATATAPTSTLTPVKPATLAPPKPTVPPVTQVTTETTVLPTAATSAPTTTPAPVAPAPEAATPESPTGGTPAPPGEEATPPSESTPPAGSSETSPRTPASEQTTPAATQPPTRGSGRTQPSPEEPDSGE
jgi:RNA polymerase sigma factor (sigma-70 family)